MPTNQEWIFAAKGGEDYEYAGSSDIEEVAWYKGNSGSKTHPVAQKKANSYGLYDMNGNVAEMCSDFSSRGGAFNDYMSDCRIASGFYSLGHNIGFRIVRTIK